MIWSAIGGLLSGGVTSVLNSILAPVLGYFTTARNDDLAGFEEGAKQDAATYQAYLAATIQMAQIKASQNTWFGARLIILLTAGSASLHFTAIMLDSLPIFGHAVGSWSVPKLPPPYDGYEWTLLQSFFLTTPIAPALSAVATWLHRK